MHCAYQFEDDPQCPNEPVDSRACELSDRDRVVFLLCEWHAKAWDAFQWARRKRAEAR